MTYYFLCALLYAITIIPLHAHQYSQQLPQFLILDQHINTIIYPTYAYHYQLVNCSQQQFILVENEYQLIPSYNIQSNALIPHIYKQQFTDTCTISNHFEQCKLLVKHKLLYTGLARGFRFNFLLSMRDLYEYFYNCSTRIIPVHGYFALNQLYTHTITAHIDNCRYQTYSHNPIVNYAKSIINYFTKHSNHKCFIYHNTHSL